MSGQSSQTLVQILYLISAVLFIVGLKGLTKVRTARRGNAISAVAMLIAIVGTLLELGTFSWTWIVVGLVLGSLIGWIAAVRVEMTGMPEMVALFNGAGGAASVLVALSITWLHLFELHNSYNLADGVTIFLSILIGGVTFTGSIVAFLKLRDWISGQPILLPGRHALNLLLLLGSVAAGLYFAASTGEPMLEGTLAMVACGLALVLGVTLVIPIGGADMPVVISLLNSYSGLAACATGFILSNNVLIISGALVGASGLILTQVMCKAMNRSLTNVLFGGFGAVAATGGGGGSSDYKTIRSYSAEEAAMVLESASSVIFVPGYGLAVAQAQHLVREMANLLEARGVDVKYAIHPVAGRMPGHMNVLLAEADVPYEQLVEMDQINPEFRNTDVVLVVGANDVVNPAATKDKGSPIWGMPILEVFHAGTVVVIKRSLAPGFAGIKNELFEYDNTMMLFADAKKALQDLVAQLKESAA